MRRFKITWKSLTLSVIALSIAPINNTSAQEKDSIENTFSLSLNFRPRLEIRDGAFRPLASNERVAALVSDRMRINMNYSYKNLLTVKISPQVVSVWGQANMVQGAENVGNKFSLFESWAKLRISPSWSTKIGRQVISLDDERFFGELDWAQGGRAHDAVSVEFAKNKFEVKGFFAYNQNYKTLYGNNLSNPAGYDYATTDAFPHKWMQTIWAKFPLGEKSKITLLVANLGFQQATITNTITPEFYSQTYGANYFFGGKKINAQVAAYFQGGKNITGATTEAYTATANIGYHISDQWTIGIGSDLISGNDIGVAQSRNTAFNPYFQTGHKFYGFMDYYYAGNTHRNVGISDSYLKVNFKAKKNFSLGMVLHQFVTPNKVINLNQEYNSNLGQEMDLTVSYKINKFASLTGGYSFYLATPTVKFLKGVPTGMVYQQWAWVSLNITPTLFEYKK